MLASALPACLGDEEQRVDNDEDLGQDNEDEVLPGEQLNDGEIAHVVATVNAGEIHQSTTARSRLQTDIAITFADQMLAAHSESDDELNEVILDSNIDLEANEISEDIENTSDAIVAELQQAALIEIDRVYLESQVRTHGEVLVVIDEDLMDDVNDNDLRDFLVGFRADVAAHLAEAEQAVDDLDAFEAGER